MARARAAGFSQQVRFLGERPDVGRLLQAADIYCQPNLSAEPFGLAFVEALAAGLPVVTTRLGAAPEIVDDRCGVLVDAGSAGAVATALRGLIEQGAARHTMGAAARLRARTFCDLSQSLPRLAAVLSRAAQPTPVLT
jgi:glycosyltransferase involved in cell wall biosynthesis